ncbi:DUF1501 domain-containing protein [Segetibacter sp. 3557_3]|uniref:DUF1501 domain-containing protein n=1 Tax=Segetibacter sp. 3557_3 TaxID=2547429 RepID=UPI001058DD3F|nr:DUF1501 domain-containing protein [Segetibacter sp. 3557_3]TDH21387.1 DUF1501 domain-containing protein [Segetibacter sp. 3557_3]
MQRRKFLRNTAASAVALPGLINGFNMKAYGEGSMLHNLYTSVVQTDHILVIIQMAGGNDGLNTVIPLDQYSNYFNARSNIAIAENKVLALTGTSATGLNPALGGLRDLYNDGKVCIVQSAGYPSPNFSHFRATDIWLSASNQDEYISNGWAGRYLNLEYPGYPNGYPSGSMPDPLAVQFGSSTSLAILGPNSQMGVTISNPDNFLNFVNDVEDAVPNTPAGERLAYVRQISKQSEIFSNVIKTSYNIPGNANKATYPNNTLANQLKIVARLINGGLKTKIYAVNYSGFDTHANQVNASDTSTGTHANQLAILGDSVKAFHTDLKLMNKDNKVIGMTFSEFGRRIKSNASMGTDHGAAAPMFLFGTPVTGGIVGANPIIPSAASVNDNIPFQTDFRSIYSSLLKRWLCQDEPSLLSEMFRTFPQIDVCSNVECLPQGGRTAPEVLVKNYPNPVINSTTVEFKTDGGHTLMQLVDKDGHIISTIMEKTFDRPTTGTQRVDMGRLKLGVYYIRFQNGNKSQMKAVLKVD